MCDRILSACLSESALERVGFTVKIPVPQSLLVKRHYISLDWCFADSKTIAQSVGPSVLLLLERPESAMSVLDARCSWGSHGLYSFGRGGNVGGSGNGSGSSDLRMTAVFSFHAPPCYKRM